MICRISLQVVQRGAMGSEADHPFPADPRVPLAGGSHGLRGEGEERGAMAEPRILGERSKR